MFFCDWLLSLSVGCFFFLSVSELQHVSMVRCSESLSSDALCTYPTFHLSIHQLVLGIFPRCVTICHFYPERFWPLFPVDSTPLPAKLLILWAAPSCKLPFLPERPKGRENAPGPEVTCSHPKVYSFPRISASICFPPWANFQGLKMVDFDNLGQLYTKKSLASPLLATAT